MSLVDGVDDPFWPMLVADARAWGVDPRVVAQVMFSESSLFPQAVNPHAKGDGTNPSKPLGESCLGINQLCPVNHHLFAPLDAAGYWGASASEQWRAGAGKFFDAQLRAHPEAKDVASLYWLNYKPATYEAHAADDYEIGVDAGNPLWTPENASSHMVTPAGMRAFATRDAGSARWKACLAAIDAAEGGALSIPDAPAPALVPPMPSAPRVLAASSDAGPFLALAVFGFFAARAMLRRKGV